MLELESGESDDPDFLVIASRLVAGAAVAERATTITAVHINHWFGERWLGFRGKFLGAAGVRSRSLRGHLGVPPFHPHRVQSTYDYRLVPGTPRFDRHEPARALHSFRTSASNLDRQLSIRGVYAWYSGDTAATGKGVVMVYVVGPRHRLGWYAQFERESGWRLSKSIGIAPRRVAEWIGPAASLAP